jgi:anti-sigma factor RsiW
MSSPHEQQDLAGAYVLEALEPEEVELFEQHLAGCSECRAEVYELREVVDVLPLACDAQEPSADLRDRILAAIADEQPERPPLKPLAGGLSEPRKGSPPRLPAFLGVAAAVLIVALGVWSVHQQQQINDQNKAIAFQKDVNAALASGATVWPLTKSTATVGAQPNGVVVQPRGGRTAYLIVKGLAATPSNKVYQLWLIRAGVPSSADVFRYSGSGPQVIQLPTATSGYGLAAITVEPAPHGSRGPTTKPVVSGKLAA